MTILEENFKWHLEAFASELFIYTIKILGHLKHGSLWNLIKMVLIGTKKGSAIVTSRRSPFGIV